MDNKKTRENLSKEQKGNSIPEEVKQEILTKLRQIGHPGLGLSLNKWAQLAALREAALLMNDRCREASSVLKANALTPTNAERVLKEMGGVTVTDQTMHNNDGLLDKFFRTYEQEELSRDVRKDLKKQKDRVAVLEEKVNKMESRDADWEDAKKKMADMEREVEELKQDKQDLLKRLDNKSAKQKTVPMVQIDLTNSHSNMS